MVGRVLAYTLLHSHPIPTLSWSFHSRRCVDSFLVPVVPSIATVVVIISVCMLVFVVAMGVYRVRIAHQHFTQEMEAAKEAEMDWDDSALTITVNPMEVILMQGLGSWGRRLPLPQLHLPCARSPASTNPAPLTLAFSEHLRPPQPAWTILSPQLHSRIKNM